MAAESALICPMCDFQVPPSDTYVLQLHFEQAHTVDSPFKIKDDPEPLPDAAAAVPSGSEEDSRDAASDSVKSTVLCPEPDCGETVLLFDLNEHLDLHAAEKLSHDPEAVTEYPHQSTKMQSLATEDTNLPSFLEHNFNTDLPDALRTHDQHQHKLKRKSKKRVDSLGSEKSTLTRSILNFNPFARQNKVVKPPASTVRLGRTELGPYAWEDRMPKWLHKQLEEGPEITVVNRIGRDGRLIKEEHVQNETSGIIPILAQLSALDRSVKEAYYCHPSVLHIGKTPKEGGFCGYRNIQMLISYIQGARAQGFEEFPGRTPGILKLQDMVERAWDKGINDIGRQQTGGIRDTRKYIGTPEAQALFLSAQLDCAVEMFADSSDGQTEAHEKLFVAVERYFQQAAIPDGSNVYKTLLPPIYLQQPGHSLTIVGFERRKDGSCNLMTFDPMFHTSPSMYRLIGRKNIRTHRPEVMHAYRKTARQLRKHAAFEILMLTAHPPLFPAWDVLRQFPDCRYVYVFFRSRTLGYDVYPEDHFLRSFPWQQYGGLWVVEDARFARADKMNPLMAAALRRLTGEGACPSSRYDSRYFSGSYLTSSPINSSPTSRKTSAMSALDGVGANPGNDLDPVLKMTGMHVAYNSHMPNQPRRFPGYPLPISPTEQEKSLFPSPTCQSPDERSTFYSLMSIDGSDMCGPSRHCTGHNFSKYGYETLPDWAQPSHRSASSSWTGQSSSCVRSSILPHARSLQHTDRVSTNPTSLSSASTISPPRPPSPRTAMLKDMYQKQAFQALCTHDPSGFPKTDVSYQMYPAPQSLTSTQAYAATLTDFTAQHGARTETTPKPTNGMTPFPDLDLSFTGNDVLNGQCHQPTIESQNNSGTPSRPFVLGATSTIPLPQPLPSPQDIHSIPIAEGLETETPSPLSSTGTLLSYTSNRTVDSGLLAVKPLSEIQVAEYRFWRPCGRRKGMCVFGCGEEGEGERSAGRRLFREVSKVRPDDTDDEDDGEAKGVDGNEWRNLSAQEWRTFTGRVRDGVADI